MSETAEKPELLRLTAHIVQSYVGNNSVGKSELPGLISSVFDTLSGTGVEPEPERLKPAVSIKRSIQPDFIVCLEDGKKLKMLKRHLSTAYGMTPDDYRERWGLPADYPMVAPNYAKRRSNLAKEIGLGQSNKRTRKPKPKVAVKR
jgi:predicted transcriptional regulator